MLVPGVGTVGPVERADKIPPVRHTNIAQTHDSTTVFQPNRNNGPNAAAAAASGPLMSIKPTPVDDHDDAACSMTDKWRHRATAAKPHCAALPCCGFLERTRAQRNLAATTFKPTQMAHRKHTQTRARARPQTDSRHGE